MAATEFTCDGPGIGPLMATFEAGIDPYLNYIKIVMDPDGFALEFPELALEMTAELGLSLSIVPPLALAAAISAAIDLPQMPAPFEVGMELPGWDVDIQGLALSLTLSAMLAVPLNLILGIFLGDIDIPPVFPDIVVELLGLDVPGVDGLATCISEKLEPLFVTPA